jgi:hypothetical protein
MLTSWLHPSPSCTVIVPCHETAGGGVRLEEVRMVQLMVMKQDIPTVV